MDIIEDLIDRLAARLPSASDVLAEVEREIRDAWAGDEPYIRRQRMLCRRTRNACIRRDYRTGESVRLLARRYGLSRRHIRRIIGDIIP